MQGTGGGRFGGLDPPLPVPPACSTACRSNDSLEKMTIHSGYALFSLAATFSKSVVKR